MAVIHIDDKAVPLIEGGGGGGGCFAPNTSIYCESGYKIIKDIEVGDKVWAYNEIGQLVISEVKETFYHTLDHIYRVTHEQGYLDVTPNHWILQETGKYKELKDFSVGENLINVDGNLTKIISIEFLRQGPVYNFIVSHVHSYIANSIRVHNGGGGGKSGGGKEDPNSLFSTDILFITMGLGEGPVYRINPNGLSEIEFNEGNIDDLLISGQADNSKFYTLNNNGSILQARLPLFGDYIFTPQKLQSAVELKSGNVSGVPKSSLDKQDTSVSSITALKFYFILNGLQKQKDNGDVIGYSVSIKVTVYDRLGTTVLTSQTRTIQGKTNIAYSFDIYAAIPLSSISPNGYKFTVEKTSSDSSSVKIQDNVSFYGWTEITEHPIAYTRTATSGFALKAFSEHKGSLPAISQMVKGLLIKVPSNYNQPILANGEIDWREIEVSDSQRTSYGYRQQKTGNTVLTTQNPIIYDGLWDGQFIYSWTQNPAWIIYDLLTNQSYGLGIPEENIDKYTFYEVSVYNDACDPNTGRFIGVESNADGTYRYKPRGTKTAISELLVGLSIGTSIKERRFILDTVISDQKQVMDIINILTLTFRGLLFYAGGKISIYQDKPEQMPVAIFNESNIIKDTIAISGISEEELITGVDISYSDPTLHYRREVLRIDDPKALEDRNNIENTIKIDLEGVTRKSQAIRLAQYIIADPKYCRRKIGFKTGIEASELMPGSVIAVSQRAASVAWGYGGILFENSVNSNTWISLEHIGMPGINSSVFTANTKPLVLRISSSDSGLVDLYLLSNTEYQLATTANVTNGYDIVRVKALKKYNHSTKNFSTFTGSWGTSHFPKRYDIWSLGNINNPNDVYTSTSDKLFKITNMKREDDETVFVEAREYISNVYIDSDVLINYTPLVFNDYFNPLLPPPPPNFELTAIPQRDMDGSVFTDIELSYYVDRTGYTNELSTEFFHAPPSTSHTTILAGENTNFNDIKTLTLSSMEGVTEGDTVGLFGKNGFTTTVGYSQLLVTNYDITDIDPVLRSNGYITLTVKGLPGLIDTNFGSSIHVLDVNNTFIFDGLRGADKISIPLNQKTSLGTDGSAAGLLGYLDKSTSIVGYSANVEAFYLGNSIINILNDSSGESTLSSLLPNPPFYIGISQIIDPRYFSNNQLYITGSYLETIRTNTISTSNIIESHVFKQPLGISVLNKNFCTVSINGIGYSDFTLENGLDNLANSQVSINLNTLPTAINTLDLRVYANSYTIPAIEVNDTINFNAEKSYTIIDSTYDVLAPSYNVALTANGIYRITLDDNISSNISAFYAINITPNPIGTIGNVNVSANTITLDYFSNNYVGDLNLTNNKIYAINAPFSTFQPLSLDGASKRVIAKVDEGYHSVKGRTVNKYGRRSPYVTKTIYVEKIPIRAVDNLLITEQLYKDTSIGVATRIIIEFDHITAQEVTDYEISYKVSGPTGDLTSFNTLKVSAIGADENNKINIKLDSIEKGLSGNPNSIIVRVTPLNKSIRGSTLVKQQNIIGKTAPPQNVQNFAVGQTGDSLILVWQYKVNETSGDNYDIDLLEVQVKKILGTIDTTSQSTLLETWPKATSLITVDARTNRILVDIDQFGEYSYLVRTKDTSDILSSTVIAYTFTSTQQNFTNTFAAYSEDDPATPFAFVSNRNNSEIAYASFYVSNTGGLAYSLPDSLFNSNVVDNSNGTATGWSVAIAASDIKATANAMYQTQIRDIGSVLTVGTQVDINAFQSIKTNWIDYADQIGENQITESGSSGILRDIDFSGSLGIGNILGVSNSSAAPVVYSNLNSTLSSGIQDSIYYSNIYAIVSIGNYDGDTANANVLSLIAGTVNANAIVLGESWFANGKSIGSNGFSNLQIAGSSYKLVNLRQWIDLNGATTFYGTSGIISSNVDIRYTSTNPYYANGNVNISAFTTTANSDGYVRHVTGPKALRYFQFRYVVNNLDPSQYELVLDKFRYRVTLEERSYSTTVTVDQLVTPVDYTLMNYYNIPKITGTIVTTSGDQLAQPQVVIIDRTKTGANISVYFSNGVSAHDIAPLPEVDFSIIGV
jgi:hypothetical protein